MEQTGNYHADSHSHTEDWKSLQNTECVEQIDLLIRTVQLVRAALNNSFAQLEINEVRYAALKVIGAARETGCSQSELARKLGQSESNICTLVERMEGDQLIIRQQSQQDRRKRVLQVTEPGERILEQVKDYHAKVSQRLLSSLNSDQRRQLNSILKALLKSANIQRAHKETARTNSDISPPYPYQSSPAA